MLHLTQDWSCKERQFIVRAPGAIGRSYARSDEIGNLVIDHKTHTKRAVRAFLCAFHATLALPSLDGLGDGCPGHLFRMVGNLPIFLDYNDGRSAGPALGDGADQRGTDQERVDLHLQETGDGADTVIGVQCRINQ